MNEQDKKSSFPKPPGLDFTTGLESDDVEVPDGKTPQESMDGLNDTLHELMKEVEDPQVGKEPLDTTAFAEEEAINPSLEALLMTLRTQIREKVEIATIENCIALEDHLLVKARSVRGELFLILLKEESREFEVFGGDNAEKIPEDKIESTFGWLKNDDRKIQDFFVQSQYVKNAMISQEGEPIN